MREIDPQSRDPLREDPQTDARLTEALRHLSGATRQGAPAEIGAGLVTAFRRHHTRRRRIRLAGVAALVACIAFMAGLMSMRPPRKTPVTEQANAQSSSVLGKTPNAVATTNAVTTQLRPVGTRIRPKPVTSKAATNRAAANRQFLALPGYDPAVPADELHVVRVQLPASALWQMGAPVNPDSGGRRVLADFVVSQDGTPYAMRLVQ